MLQYSKFELRGCSLITEVSVLKISEICPRLLDLTLTGRGITDMSIVRIAESCPDLQSIDLPNCREIMDASVIRIAESCPSMLNLYLYYCKITDMCVIRMVKMCPRLQDLNLGDCNTITDTSTVEFKKKMKNCPSSMCILYYGMISKE